MAGVINICNTRINGMARNGSMNFGEVLHNGHTADVKSVGINSTYGDI
ncbi:spore germination protein [Priestia megaterium]